MGTHFSKTTPTNTTSFVGDGKKNNTIRCQLEQPDFVMVINACCRPSHVARPWDDNATFSKPTQAAALVKGVYEGG